jgi:hypothetical protein
MAPEVKTTKNSKLSKLPKNCFEQVGKGRWPTISSCINPHSLGINGLHFVEFPHHMSVGTGAEPGFNVTTTHQQNPNYQSLSATPVEQMKSHSR